MNVIEWIKNKSLKVENTFKLKPFLEFSDKTLKIRRNLNVSSLIGVILTILGVRIQSVSFAGIRVQEVTEDKLFLVLFFVSLYHLIYFLWNSIDEYWKWRLQLIVENSDDESERKTEKVSLSESQVSIDENLVYSKEAVTYFYNQIVSSFTEPSVIRLIAREPIKTQVEDGLQSAWCNTLQPIIEQDLARLYVYERSFKNYGWQQVIRFLALEFGLPVLLSMYAISSIAIKLWT